MILILEIIMLIFGIITLCKGKIQFSNRRVTDGPAAYVTGVFLILPLPLAFMVGLVLGAILTQRGQQIPYLTLALIEGGIAIACGLVAIAIAGFNSHPPAPKPPLPEREEDYDDDDRDNLRQEQEPPPERYRRRPDDRFANE